MKFLQNKITNQKEIKDFIDNLASRHMLYHFEDDAKDILDKNLISVSVSKAKSFELVLNKLREQIMENLHGKQFNISQTNFEKDLAKKPESFIDTNNDENKIDFQSEKFTDTFEQFTDNNLEEGIEAWDGNDFSYL